MNTEQLEQKAYEKLTATGHKVLLRSYECPKGTIDFITKTGGTLNALNFITINRMPGASEKAAAVYYMKRYGIKDVTFALACVNVDEDTTTDTRRSADVLPVTVVDIRTICGDGSLKAFADVKFGELFIVKGFHILKKKNGLEVMGPRKPSKDGKWFDQITWASAEYMHTVQDAVMAAYERELSDLDC